MTQPQEQRDYAFAHGEIIFVVKHTESRPRAAVDVREFVGRTLNSATVSNFISTQAEGLELPDSDDRIVSFDRFSLGFGRYAGGDGDLINLTYQLYRATIEFPNEFRDEEHGLSLVGITPHWLSMGAPNEPPVPPDLGGGGGGPGSKPISVSPSPAQDTFDPDTWNGAPWNFRLALPDSLQLTPEIARYIVERVEKSPSPRLRSWLGAYDPDSEASILESAQQAVRSAHEELEKLLKERWTTEDTGKVKVIILDTAPPARKREDINEADWQSRLIANYQIQLNNGEITVEDLMKLSPPRGLLDAFHEWSANPLLYSLLKKGTGKPDFSSPGSLDSDVLHIRYNPDFNDDPPGSPGYDGGDDRRRTCKRIITGAQFEYTDWAMDHGLFIAGIIHTLAPKVQLYLIEVLNAYAGGDLKGYADGFRRLEEIRMQEFDPDDVLVVNMSWMFNIPTDNDQPDRLKDIMITGVGRFIDVFTSDPAYRDFVMAPIRQPLNLIEDETAQIQHTKGVLVAAAGNDGNGHVGHPTARYPALFSSVTGVAALGSNGDYTPYSNQADKPQSDGIAVFGGDVVLEPQEVTAGNFQNVSWATPGGGILGVYIGEFPDRSPDKYNNPNPDPFKTAPNENGWARWSGTSFATPIVAGFLAELIRRGWSGNEAMEIVRLAFVEPATGGPDFVRVLQGN